MAAIFTHKYQHRIPSFPKDQAHSFSVLSPTKSGHRAPRPCENSPSAHVLLRQSVLYGGHERSTGSRRQRGFDGASDGIARVV